MPETIHERLERERKASQPDAAQLRTFRAYARGKQSGTLTPAQRDILRSVTGRRWCDNVVRMVLQAATGRLLLARWDVDNAAVLRWLNDWWTLAQIPVLAQQTHWATLRDGNHAVTLAWEGDAAGRVRLARERWWDGKTGIWVAYDALDQPRYAVKDWREPDAAGVVRERRVIYFPDQIQRYIRSGEGWQPFRLADDPAWPVPWVDGSGAPLGLPLVHFRNAWQPTDDSEDDASYGTSELDGGVIGLQDEVNDIQRDITAAARQTAFQQLWGTGVTEATDEVTGEPQRIRVEPGIMYTDASPAARFGVFPAGSITQLELALNLKLRAISRMTATPLHQITGDWPSGEALVQADAPLVKKTTAMGFGFAPAWASLAHKATGLANAFGGQALDTTAMIRTEYRPADRPDLATAAAIVSLIAPYISEREILRQLNFAADKVDQIMAEREQERMAAVARQQAAFGATGQPPPPGNGRTAVATTGRSDGAGAPKGATDGA